MDLNELNSLAIQAKRDGETFQIVLKKMEPVCRMVAIRYESWMADREEIMQWARIEVWNAVKTFQEGKMNFYSFCKLTVVNHIKKRVYRLYGNGNQFNRTAVRLDAPMQHLEEYKEADSYVEWITDKSGPTPQEIFFHRLFRQDLYDALHSRNLTPLEYNCMILFYFEDYSHKDIQNILKLNSRKAVDNALVRVRNKLSKNRQLYEIFQMLKAAI